MSTGRPPETTHDKPVSGKEPSLSDNRSIPVPSPVTGSEPTLSGDEGLLHALEMTLHENPNIRFNAVSALEQFRDANTLDRLLNMLADPDQNTRNRAAWALVRFGEVAAPGLLDTVRSSKNERAREEAAWALSTMELPSFVPRLIGLLEDEESEGLEGFIVQAICQACTDDALAYLLQYLQRYRQEFDEQEFIQPESIPDLADILAAFEKAHYISAGPVLLDLLPEASEHYGCIRIISTLAALNYQPACDVLLHVAKDHQRYHADARRAALKGLHTLQGDPFIPQLIQLFDDGSTELKCDIMCVLAYIDGSQAAELIRAQLRSDDVRVQYEAIRLAGWFRVAQSTLPLIELLSDTSIQVRNTITDSLGELKDERAVLPLKNILDSLEMVWLDLDEREDEPWVQARDHIIPALRSIGTLQAREIVKEWESENPEPPRTYWDWYV